MWGVGWESGLGVLAGAEGLHVGRHMGCCMMRGWWLAAAAYCVPESSVDDTGYWLLVHLVHCFACNFLLCLACK